jgi:hypothetical protein
MADRIRAVRVVVRGRAVTRRRVASRGAGMVAKGRVVVRRVRVVARSRAVNRNGMVGRGAAVVGRSEAATGRGLGVRRAGMGDKAARVPGVKTVKVGKAV